MSMTADLPRVSLAAQALALRDTPRQIDPAPRPAALLPISYVRGRAWFVASAASVAMRWDGSGFPAERAIEGLGFETYVPRETRRVPYRGHRVERTRPLLGSYLFVRFDRNKDEWGEIRAPDPKHGGGLKGIYGVLRDKSGLPIRALDSEVVRLQRLEAAGAFDFTGGVSNLKIGDDVRVMDGPFLHMVGKIRNANHRRKLEIIMGNLVVKISPEFVEKV